MSPPTSLDKWLKKTTRDDTGLTRPVYKVVGRPTQDSIKREEVLTTVTNVFMTQYTIPIDTTQLTKLPSRDDVETWWMINEQTMDFRSEHDWTIDV